MATSPGPRRTRGYRALGFVVVLLAAASLILFHEAVHTWSWTDENIHQYVASRIADGLVPWQDIHTTRGPLALTPLVVLLKAGIPALAASRTVVGGAILATAALLFLGARRAWSEPVAWLVCAGYLACPGVFGQWAFTGMNLVSLGCTACVVAWLYDRPAWAGVAAGLALATGQHAAVVCAVVAILFVIREWRWGLTYLACATGVAAACYGACVVLCGEGVFQALVGHHLYHVAGSDPGTDAQFGFLYRVWWADNLLVLLLFIAGTVIAVLTRHRARTAMALAALVILHHLVVIAMAGGQFLYIHAVTPLIVLGAGGVFAHFDDWTRPDPTGNSNTRFVPPLAVLLGLGWLAMTLAGWSLAGMHLGQRDHETYPLLPHLRRIEMAKIQDMHVAHRIATDPTTEGTIFGYGTVASLVALESGRRMAGEYADLSPRWFVNGTLDRHQVIREIEDDQVAWFVTPKAFYLEDDVFRAYLTACYEAPEIWPRSEGRGRGIPRLFVFRRTEDTACTDRLSP